MRDPDKYNWLRNPDAHPEYLQREVDEIVAAHRGRRRLSLGLALFTLIGLALLLITIRNHLPEGW